MRRGWKSFSLVFGVCLGTVALSALRLRIGSLDPPARFAITTAATSKSGLPTMAMNHQPHPRNAIRRAPLRTAGASHIWHQFSEPVSWARGLMPRFLETPRTVATAAAGPDENSAADADSAWDWGAVSVPDPEKVEIGEVGQRLPEALDPLAVDWGAVSVDDDDDELGSDDSDGSESDSEDLRTLSAEAAGTDVPRGAAAAFDPSLWDWAAAAGEEADGVAGADVALSTSPPPKPGEPKRGLRPAFSRTGKPKLYGKIISWDYSRGFGFIMPDGGEDAVFCHQKNLVTRLGGVHVGDAVTYKRIFNARSEMWQAGDVQVLLEEGQFDAGDWWPMGWSGEETGKIITFDQTTGYGFIKPARGGENIFVHQSGFLFEDIRAGDEVYYVKEFNHRNKKFQAGKVRNVLGERGWDFDVDDGITYEEEGGSEDGEGTIEVERTFVRGKKFDAEDE